MAVFSHRLLIANGVRVHAVEAGEGPLVLMLHGFPESWYSWRHQLPAVAAGGFRAVAVDVRGYGRSSAPADVDAYRMLLHVADAVETVAALGHHSAVIVGHDWGAPIAANCALLRPDVFRAVALLSVPYAPAGSRRPTDVLRERSGDEESYINYFQAPGRAEAEIEPDVAGWLRGFYVAASGDGVRSGGASIATVAPGGRLRDRFGPPGPLPSWLSEEDLAFYTGEFERTGFSGPLNRYRNIDRDWEDLRAFRSVPIAVPALFIGGELDGPTVWGKRAIERFDQTLPRLHGSHILPGCGHWVQQERPEEVNRLLAEFLESIRG